MPNPDILAPFIPISPRPTPIHLHSSFTTSPHLHTNHTYVPFLPLAPESALGIHKVSNPKVLTHRVVRPPPPARAHQPDSASTSIPEEAWEAVYPAGSINPSGAIKGGFGFYMSGPSAFQDALAGKEAREVVCGYEVMFEEGFEWAKGGKLPGICAFISSFVTLSFTSLMDGVR